jgi:hypothetical protein
MKLMSESELLTVSMKLSSNEVSKPRTLRSPLIAVSHPYTAASKVHPGDAPVTWAVALAFVRQRPATANKGASRIRFRFL